MLGQCNIFNNYMILWDYDKHAIDKSLALCLMCDQIRESWVEKLPSARSCIAHYEEVYNSRFSIRGRLIVRHCKNVLNNKHCSYHELAYCFQGKHQKEYHRRKSIIHNYMIYQDYLPSDRSNSRSKQQLNILSDKKVFSQY